MEDEEIVAADFAQKLDNLGYQIITARGEEAVTLARDQRPDSVEMDVRLQRPMDGIEAATSFARNAICPSFT